MARKRKQEEQENHERWLVSYADFITLLFAFFVVMYSVSAINEGKFRVLSDALVSAFHAPPKSLAPIQVGRPSKSPVISELEFRSSPNFLITPKQIRTNDSNEDGENRRETDNDYYNDAGSQSLDEISDDIELAMAHLIELGLIHIRRNELWLEIEIKSNILFKSGSAVIKRETAPVLAEIGQILSRFPNMIRVEGYTDSQSIKSQIYPSNWELSAARAASVVRLFELSKVHSERLTAVGYGENRPVADNSTESGRAKNRRVVVVIMANNDVARINHKPADRDNRKPVPVEMKTLADNGLIEREKKVVSQQQQADGLSIFRQSAPEEVFRIPEMNSAISQNTGGIRVIAPPVRLFTPVKLPKFDIINREK